MTAADLSVFRGTMDEKLVFAIILQSNYCLARIASIC